MMRFTLLKKYVVGMLCVAKNSIGKIQIHIHLAVFISNSPVDVFNTFDKEGAIFTHVMHFPFLKQA